MFMQLGSIGQKTIRFLLPVLFVLGSIGSAQVGGPSAPTQGPFTQGTRFVVFTSDATISSTEYTTYNVVVIGCTLTVDCAGGPTQWESLHVTNGGTVTCPDGSSAGLDIAGNYLFLGAGCSIDADELGHLPGQGPGAGTGPPSGDAGGGASFGGRGGLSNGGGSSEGEPGAVYGDHALAGQLGSGGGDTGISTGGRGGGMIRLVLAGTARIDGTVSANGGDASLLYNYCGGGGSGGSVLVDARVLRGSGSIEANGGSTHSTGGGGGGGRIVLLRTQSSFVGQVTAIGGEADSPGGAGSCYRKVQSSSSGELVLDNGSISGGVTHFAGVLTVDGDLDVVSNAILSAPALETLEVVVTGDLYIDATAEMNVGEQGYSFNLGPGAGTSPPNGNGGGGGSFGGRGGQSNGGWLSEGEPGPVYGDYLLADQFGSGGGTSASSWGGSGGGRIHLEVAGTAQIDGTVGANGGDTSPWYSFCGGGGHGGPGGDSNGGWIDEGLGGPSYDDPMLPFLPGSGGGTAGSSIGGYGGGAIRLDVAGTTHLDGVVTANGGDTSVASSFCGGGGSGGGILIDTDTLSGSGPIHAIGGSTNSFGGGGGGGRIAIYRIVDLFTGSISVAGGVADRSGASGSLEIH